jgi:hypothetical protein
LFLIGYFEFNDISLTKLADFCKLGVKLKLGKVWGCCDGVIESYVVRRMEGRKYKGRSLERGS